MHPKTSVPSVWYLLAALSSLTLASRSEAQVAVTLQNPSATVTQIGFSTGATIDGISTGNDGWAIWDGVATSAQTIYFETAADAGFSPATQFTFTLAQDFTGDIAPHTIGRFRLSYTTDTRGALSSWTVLAPMSSAAASGATMTTQGDNSVLVSGTLTQTDIYQISATTNATFITGFRLEVMEDPSLPDNGPGRGNSNLVLTEFSVSATAVPEPGAYAALAGLAALGGVILRRRRAA